VRCDLHVHTRHSGDALTPVLSRLCRESYNDPKAVYARLKQLGMDLVTITDHDSIDAAESLRHHQDFFLSEEVTCRMPSGTELHVGVYDINEHQHIEIQRRRHDLPSLLAYLGEQELFFSVNHLFSRITGKRRAEDFNWLEEAFPALETLNAHLPLANNLPARQLALWMGKAMLGGSDAHALVSLGSAFTEVPSATKKEEFLRGLRYGHATVHGNSGNYWTLTREVLAVVTEMMNESRAKILLAPFMPLVPLAIAIHRVLEWRFARRWVHHLATSRGILSDSHGPISPRLPEEVLV